MNLTDYLAARFGRDQMLAWADDAKEEELDEQEEGEDE